MTDAVLPSQVTDDLDWFDRFAGRASQFTSRAPFFFGCVVLVLVWAPSYPLWGNGDTWQLVINTTTTIVTFVLVALLHNAQTRNDQATQHKLNAIAEALAHFMDVGEANLSNEVEELRQAVGLERQESTA